MPPSDSFTMPAEFSPHAGTWLAWPHRTSDWPGKFAVVPWVYVEIVRLLSRFERVNVVVRDASQEAKILRMLTQGGADPAHVVCHHIPTDRSWLRDSGPIFVHTADGRKTALDWHFNAWAKYPDWQTDDKVPAAVAKRAKVPVVRPMFAGRRIVLEGGSIDVNGAGTMLTTEECLLSTIQERNPGLTRKDYDALFAQYLGIRTVVWLDRGVVGDDTHGHVDDLARFVNPKTVVVCHETDSNDENYRPLQDNWERLQGAKGADGKKLSVVKLPMPLPVVFKGQRLPASYANFYIANGVVLMPTFNDPNDRIALGILAELFGDRDVIGIHAVDLVWGLGTLHCLSQQEPV